MIQGSSAVRCVLVCALAACTDPALDTAEQAAVVCGKGPTVKGIDVSYYQGAIDWPAVRADGVEYAFIRVGDGVDYVDSRFEPNWAGAAAQGILRGAYQFFRPNKDPIAQADILLAKLAGQPGELPPVIDVEVSGGLSPGQVEAAVRAWIDRVRPAIGREPVIYTGYYFWRDGVGAPDMTGSPLWHAQYTTAACPNIASPWTDWAFWQFTSTGRVAGIVGDVDVNRWNGTRADLDAFAEGAARPCGIIGPEGGEIDDGDACFTAGGPPQYLRPVAGTGAGGDLVWTYTTASADEVSFGHWELVLAEAGRYRIEVSTPAPFARSRRARYAVTAAGERRELVLDQSAADGWQLLGELDFAAGGGQSIHLGDNTGEPGSDKIQLVFDAIRLTRVPPGEEQENPPGDGGGGGDGGGCAAGGGRGGGAPGFALGLGALALALGRRRRRRPASMQRVAPG
jgi:lysozyme